MKQQEVRDYRQQEKNEAYLSDGSSQADHSAEEEVKYHQRYSYPESPTAASSGKRNDGPEEESKEEVVAFDAASRAGVNQSCEKDGSAADDDDEEELEENQQTVDMDDFMN